MEKTKAKVFVGLAKALIALRGESYAQVQEGVGIHKATISLWLRGGVERMAEPRQAELLSYLGVQNGKLREDMKHQWAEATPFTNLKEVLQFLSAEQGRPLLERRREPADETAGARSHAVRGAWDLGYPGVTVGFEERVSLSGGPSLQEALGGLVAYGSRQPKTFELDDVERIRERVSSDMQADRASLQFFLERLLSHTSNEYRDSESGLWVAHLWMMAEAISREMPFEEAFRKTEE